MQSNSKQNIIRHFGLAGSPVSQSCSPKYFTDKWNKGKINNCEYELFDINSKDELCNLLDLRKDLEGLNITSPLKREVIDLADEISEKVKISRSANTLKINYLGNKRHISAYNTDILGFKSLLEKTVIKENIQAIILGTGGAARSVAYVLKERNINFQYVSRKKLKGTITYEELSNYDISNFKLIVNCSILGMHGKYSRECPPIPYHNLSPDNILIDLIYNPETTVFLQKGKNAGCKTINGKNMLEAQADASWNIWNSIN